VDTAIQHHGEVCVAKARPRTARAAYLECVDHDRAAAKPRPQLRSALDRYNFRQIATFKIRGKFAAHSRGHANDSFSGIW
jgi:hypothetical protein